MKVKFTQPECTCLPFITYRTGRSRTLACVLDIAANAGVDIMASESGVGLGAMNAASVLEAAGEGDVDQAWVSREAARSIAMTQKKLLSRLRTSVPKAMPNARAKPATSESSIRESELDARPESPGNESG